MNGFIFMAFMLTGVLLIVLWGLGMVKTFDYVEKFGFSIGKATVIGVVGYLAATIAVLFGIGLVV